MENATNSSVVTNDADSLERITKTAICMFVLGLSLIENIVVLVVLKKDFKKSLRTANSYFIANMSVADVLFALQNLPLAYNNILLHGHWVIQGIIGLTLCKIDIFFSLISMVTTNLTILAIAVNRFFAVYAPLRKIITRRVCFSLIFLTWLVSAVLASPLLYYADFVSPAEHLTYCTLTDQQVVKTWYIILTGILATTLVAMLVLYTAIGLKLRRLRMPGTVSERAFSRREKRNRDIFKMLVTLIVVFYICYLPLLVLQMSNFLGFFTSLQTRHAVFAAVVMMSMNGVINPVIYFVFNESFRDGVKMALSKCGCCPGAVYSVHRHMTASRRTYGRTSTRM